ncbi:MAG: Ig-like domain repeat protein [Methylococcales bacterium]|nr:Ig-like domain repeat protein [Methylococcales bacterium]
MDLIIFRYLKKNLVPVLWTMLLALQTTGLRAEIPHSLSHIQPRVQITRPVNDADRVTLSGNRLPILDAGIDQGPVSDNLVLKGMILHLNSDPEQQAALEAFNLAQQTPGNPDYHHWLTPEEFASRFGASATDIATLSNYLTSKGFKIDSVAAGGRSIVFTGTAGQLKNTFHTEIHHFLWHGKKHIANINDPQIPAAFANIVNGLVNLHDFHSRSYKHSLLKQNNTPAVGMTLPGDYTSQADIFPITNYNIGGSNYLTPDDYAVIYNIGGLYNTEINGSGFSITVLGRTDVLSSDISSFQSFAGQTIKLPQVTITNTDPGYVSGDQLESSLDLEWATGIAPGASVKFITSASTGNTDGIQLSASYAVQNNIGDIISLSYSSCEHAMGRSQVNYWSSLWNQAATQGQTVMVAAGDAGAADCDIATNTTATGGAYVNGLCSSQYDTCVGGTQFNDTANPSLYWSGSNPSGLTTTALSYIPESVWNASGSVAGGSDLWASGGGKSVYWSKPSWQAGTGVPADGKRDVPDVALAASTHDGYIVYLNGSQVIVGGTSAATPSFAGMIALLLQYTGQRQGNINPSLYGLFQLQIAGSYNYFHITVSGNNSVPGQTGYTASGAGYNLATGLGSVNAGLLIRHWSDLSNKSSLKVHAALASATAMLTPVDSSVSLSASAGSITAGQSVNLTATVSGDSPTGSVQFYAGATLLGIAALNNDVASLTTSALSTAGGNTLTAVYGGDANNLSATSTALIETVLAATTITVTTSADTVSAGQNITLTATLTGSSPTGSVQFYLNGAALGSAVAVANGVAVLTTPLTITGQDSITASYSGDSLNAAITSTAITETVTAAQPQQVPALSPVQEWLLACLLAGALLRLGSRKPAGG